MRTLKILLAAATLTTLASCKTTHDSNVEDDAQTVRPAAAVPVAPPRHAPAEVASYTLDRFKTELDNFRKLVVMNRVELKAERTKFARLARQNAKDIDPDTAFENAQEEYDRVSKPFVDALAYVWSAADALELGIGGLKYAADHSPPLWAKQAAATLQNAVNVGTHLCLLAQDLLDDTRRAIAGGSLVYEKLKAAEPTIRAGVLNAQNALVRAIDQVRPHVPADAQAALDAFRVAISPAPPAP